MAIDNKLGVATGKTQLSPSLPASNKPKPQTAANAKPGRPAAGQFEGLASRPPTSSPGKSAAQRQKAAALLDVAGKMAAHLPKIGPAVGVAMQMSGKLLEHASQFSSASTPTPTSPTNAAPTVSKPTANQSSPQPTPELATQPSPNNLSHIASMLSTATQLQSMSSQAMMDTLKAHAAVINGANAAKLENTMGVVEAANLGTQSVNKIAIAGAKSASELAP